MISKIYTVKLTFSANISKYIKIVYYIIGRSYSKC